MLAWPHDGSDWRDLLPGIEQDFLQLAQAILQNEALLIICRDASHRSHIESLFEAARSNQQPLFFAADYNDTWCRDFGPVTVLNNGQPVLLDFQFNGWGNRYDAALDNQLTQHLQAQRYFAAPVKRSTLILEGGSIDSDGAGALLTTESCLLNGNRNGFDKQQMEEALREQLAAQRILWLRHGRLDGDDTDSHIDNLARFAATDTIVHLECNNPDDAHYSALNAMRDELRTFRQTNGQPYQLIGLPLPDPCYSTINGRRLPASYVNFLIINNAVLVPSFGCDNDRIAQHRLQRCFPDRKIIPVNSRGFIEQNGGIHCLTMQLPLNTLNTSR